MFMIVFNLVKFIEYLFIFVYVYILFNNMSKL